MTDKRGGKKDKQEHSKRGRREGACKARGGRAGSWREIREEIRRKQGNIRVRGACWTKGQRQLLSHL